MITMKPQLNETHIYYLVSCLQTTDTSYQLEHLGYNLQFHQNNEGNELLTQIICESKCTKC